MGRFIGFVFFAIAFVLFFIFKSALFGVKKAYKAVFDPNSEDERIKEIVGSCAAHVVHVMQETYDRNLDNLPETIQALTMLVQKSILERGYQINKGTAEMIVKDSIVLGGFATREEVQIAAAKQ
jgi:exonuclease VII large subunit